MGMPENAYLSVSFDRLGSAFNRFPYGEVLVVCSKDFHDFLRGVVEADEVVDNVDQSLLCEHAI